MPTFGRADWLRRCDEGWEGAFIGTARCCWGICCGNWKLFECGDTLDICPCI